MHTLYTRPQTGGFVVHAVLEEAGLPYELVTVDTSRGDHETEEFRAISPLGRVPVLRLPDGSTMTESAAMCIYLGDLAPDARLISPPDDPLRPHFLRWLLFCAVNIYDADLRYYYADRHTTDPAAIESIKAAALADMDDLFAMLDKQAGSGDWCLGDTFSALDIYAAMLTYWHPDVPANLAACPNLARVSEQVKQRPAVIRANDYHNAWAFDGED
jgi:glutathione S-transferase